MIGSDAVFSFQRCGLQGEVVLKALVVVDARCSCDAQPMCSLGDVDRAGLSKVVDVMGNPPSKVQLPKIVDTFMVTADKDCEVRCFLVSIKIGVEAPHILILGWAVHVI